MGQKSFFPIIYKAESKKDAISKLDSLIKDCKYPNRWDLNDGGNWNAMVRNLDAVKNWIKEDVDYKGVWEVKKNVEPRVR